MQQPYPDASLFGLYAYRTHNSHAVLVSRIAVVICLQNIVSNSRGIPIPKCLLHSILARALALYHWRLNCLVSISPAPLAVSKISQSKEIVKIYLTYPEAFWQSNRYRRSYTIHERVDPHQEPWTPHQPCLRPLPSLPSIQIRVGCGFSTSVPYDGHCLFLQAAMLASME